MIDYDALADAVARANESAGLGHQVIAVDKRVLGETAEPYSSRASLQRTRKTIKGRNAAMVMV